MMIATIHATATATARTRNRIRERGPVFKVLAGPRTVQCFPPGTCSAVFLASGTWTGWLPLSEITATAAELGIRGGERIVF